MHPAIQKIVQLNEDYQAAIKADGKIAINEVIKDLFEKYPQVEAVQWRQYTPYFNDGDPCRFSCGAGDCQLKFYGEKADDEEDEDEDFQNEYDNRNYEVPERRAVFTAFGDDLASIPDDVMEEVFGDHAKVTVTREGAEVEQYDHE